MSFKFAAPFPYSEAWWRVTLSSIGDAVIVTDASGRVAFLNPVAESLTGWKNDEAMDKSLEEIFPTFKEGTHERLELPIHKVIRTGNTADLANHTVLLSKSGSEVHIDDRAAPIKGEDGNVFGVVLVFRDVSVKKQSQNEQAYLAAIVDSSEDAIVGKTLDSVITSWNHAAERMFGYSAQEAIGQRIHLLIPRERYGEEGEILTQLRQGRGIEHYETVRQKKDGTLIEVSLTVSPIKDAEGNIVGASKIARRRHGGLGLGLAIVRHLTELHGGTVAADSAGEGLGATFSVRLPPAPLGDSRQQNQNLSSFPRAVEGPMTVSEELRGVRVLVVDDETDACELLRVVLEKGGAAVRTAYSVASAFESLKQWKPDVLLSDIGMPQADGYDLIRQVRALSHKEGGSIPAAALTAYATTDDRLKVLQAGFQTHIAKPVEPMELMAVVAVLAGRTGTARDK